MNHMKQQTASCPEHIYPIFDKMMTKYSFFEHSQSSEKPVSLPEINDIVADVDEMLNWLSGYNKRKK